MPTYGVSYLPCGSYHLAGDGRGTPYRMLRSGFAASSRHAPLGGTRGGAAGEKGRSKAMGGKKNGTTAIKQSSRVICGGASGSPTRDLRLAEPLLSQLSYCPVSVYIYNITARRWERNREISSPSYLRNLSDFRGKQAGDYLLPAPLLVIPSRPASLPVEPDCGVLGG